MWRDDQVLDLNAAIPANAGATLREALAINRHGEILCSGWQGEDRRSAGFLLTPRGA